MKVEMYIVITLTIINFIVLFCTSRLAGIIMKEVRPLIERLEKASAPLIE